MRVRFPPGGQRTFLENVQRVIGVGVADLADALSLCARTIRDWRREQWQMDETLNGDFERIQIITVLEEFR